jgi:hypothetical protein
MALRHSYTQLIDQAHYDSHLKEARPWPSPAKYKSISKNDPWHDFEVRVGMRVIASVGRSPVEGYVLATIIDYDADDDIITRCVIVEVIDASNEKVAPLLYRIRPASFTNARMYAFGTNIDIVEVGKANWDKYKLGK